MAKELTPLVDTQISVITNDGRNIIVRPSSPLIQSMKQPFQNVGRCTSYTHVLGILRGFDQTTNLILDECFERVYSLKSGVEQAVLGLYIIRGDNIAVIGELDEELDSNLDLSQIMAPPLKAIVH